MRFFKKDASPSHGPGRSAPKEYSNNNNTTVIAEHRKLVSINGFNVVFVV